MVHPTESMDRCDFVSVSGSDSVCVCVCVYVRVREKERGGDGETGRESKRASDSSVILGLILPTFSVVFEGNEIDANRVVVLVFFYSRCQS